MYQIQENQVKIRSHIQVGKEQQHVVQTQVLELSANVTTINTTLSNVVNEATSKNTVAKLETAIQNLTTKQETALMYSEQRETNDKIKGLLRQLLSNQPGATSTDKSMVTSNTISACK
jgi:hypothetical protein